MRQTEINQFEQFCKECTYERNGKRYTAKTAFSQAYANGNTTRLMARDYYEMIHPWLVIRYAFDWSKDRYNDLGFWKDINHKWEEFCIKHKMACVDEFNTMSVDELKTVTRELFGGNQSYGDSPADAMDYFRIYLDERDDRIRKEKEAEEERIRIEKAKHEENQRKHEEELRKKNEKKNPEPINPVYTQSVIIGDEDEEDDEDFLILNSSYKGRARLGKGEVRIENENNNRIRFSVDDSSLILNSSNKYVCFKKCGQFIFCNDANRGMKYTLSDSGNSVILQSKPLVEYIMQTYCIKAKKAILKVSDIMIPGSKSIGFQILSVTNA